MSRDLESQNSELLADLSDAEQENIAAGWGFSGMNQPGFFFFFSQETEIETASQSEVNIAPQGISSKGNTFYSLSQKTISFGGFFGGFFPFWGVIMQYLGQGFRGYSPWSSNGD